VLRGSSCLFPFEFFFLPPSVGDGRVFHFERLSLSYTHHFVLLLTFFGGGGARFKGACEILLHFSVIRFFSGSRASGVDLSLLPSLFFEIFSL